MMRENLILKIILFMVPFCFGCKYEINTVDPQASASTKASKSDGFYIAEYAIQQPQPAYFLISEAWAEHVWINSLIDGKKEKQSVEGIQLNIKIDEYLRNKFKKEDYMILWELKDGQNNLLGMSNGVYVLPLRGQFCT